MTNQEHNKYLGLSFLVHGALQVLFMLVIMLFFGLFFMVEPGRPGNEPPLPFFIIVGAIILLFQVAFAAPPLIAAYGLLKRKSWARVMGIVAAVLSGMSFPIGTAVCVYALWFLLGEGGKEIYPQGGAAARGSLPHRGEYVPWQEQARRPERENAPPPPPPDWR